MPRAELNRSVFIPSQSDESKAAIVKLAALLDVPRLLGFPEHCADIGQPPAGVKIVCPDGVHGGGEHGGGAHGVGAQAELPVEVVYALRAVISPMIDDAAVIVASIDLRQSVEAAAQRLGIGLVEMNELLDAGEIPYVSFGGSKRTVELGELLTYEARVKAERSASKPERSASKPVGKKPVGKRSSAHRAELNRNVFVPARGDESKAAIARLAALLDVPRSMGWPVRCEDVGRAPAGMKVVCPGGAHGAGGAHGTDAHGAAGQAELPPAVANALRAVISPMIDDVSVSVGRLDRVLTEKAAENPFSFYPLKLRELLDSGEVPCVSYDCGKTRYVKLTDLLAFLERDEAERIARDRDDWEFESKWAGGATDKAVEITRLADFERLDKLEKQKAS